MSTRGVADPDGESRARRERKPAVGVVATDEHLDAVVRTVMRATRREFDVLLAHPGTDDAEVVDLAERLGVRVLDPHDPGADPETLRRALIVAADALSYPGIILTSSECRRIDFERSVAALDDAAFCVDAVPERRQSYRTAVAVPAFNEADTIADVVAGAGDHADHVVVVDDGSDDDTAARAREAGASVVSHSTNRGYGAALKTAFEEAAVRGVDQLVVLDGDGQHDPDDIPRLVDAQRDTGADVVIGSRFSPGANTDLPRYRRLGLVVVNFLTNLSMGVVRTRSRIRDTQSGFRSYTARAIRTLAADDSLGDHMGASTDILYHAHRHDYDVAEVGATVTYDVDDASHHDPVSHGLLLVSNLLKTIEREHPVLSLGVPGFASAFAGLGFGYLTLSNYVQSGAFPLGLAIISAFFGLVGVLACFTAIILHSLNQHLRA